MSSTHTNCFICSLTCCFPLLFQVFAVVNAIMLTIVNIIISESLLGKIVAPAGMIVMVGFVFAITTDDDAEPGITQAESMV